jgi:uncharacterized membrane protein YfcA
LDFITIIGYVFALVIGISLGLIGGGGSILTVPVLIYLLGVDAVTSTAYSLFIVGSTALVGAVRSYMGNNLELKIGIIFAIPSLIAVWITRAFLIPSIPDHIADFGGFELTKELAVILFFALIMLLSSFSMIKSKSKKTQSTKKSEKQMNYFLIVLEGFVVGTVTGIVGAGGGFLIIPALVLLADIPMKKAIGTSLMIIAIKSLIGFTGDLMNPEMIIDWTLLLIVSGLSIIGIFIGISIRSLISGDNLKKGFGYFLLLMGTYMIIERLMSM